MKVTFIGATHEVTGSCTLLEVGGRHFLVDCGMEQGFNVFENAPLPVPPSQIEAVFLTHAHVDHSGMLPKLCKDGFKGSIFATDATCSLCDIMLRDCAHIQMSDAEWKTRKALRAGEPAVEPEYDLDDALRAISRLRRCEYGRRYQVDEGVELRFTDVGHLLGSAAIELWLTEGEISRKIVFSGDIGNRFKPILKDPQTVDSADYLVVESTYGNRLHEISGPVDTVNELAAVLQRTLDRKGNVVIPSFAVGRTQEMLYALREIKERGLVHGHDGFPVYVDSPLANEATAIFLQCDPSYFDEEARAVLAQGVNPIWFDDIHISSTAEDSKMINMDPTPKVILSASGMCEAGRIRHHLKHNLWRKECTILFVGYQAEGSLGRSLLDGVKKVKLFGEEVAVSAEIASLHGTSGHADQKGLLDWVSAIEPKPAIVFVNHGSEQSCEDFKDLLVQKGYRAEAPYSGAQYDLAVGQMTVYAEGRRIDHSRTRTGARAVQLYDKLIAAARELLRLAQACQGRPNKDLAKFTDQIRSLIQKWQ